MFTLISPIAIAIGPKVQKYTPKYTENAQKNIPKTIAAPDWGLGPKRAALAGPPAAMVQRIPRNLCREPDHFFLVLMSQQNH